MLSAPPGRRPVVVAGLRTPFAKAGTALRDATAVDLARYCTRELLYRTELPGSEVHEIILGQAFPSPRAPNIAREVALLPQLPRSVPGSTVGRACASGAQAICQASDQIAAGHADVIIAGGAESLSDFPVLHTRRAAQLFTAAQRAGSLRERVALLAQLRVSDLRPVATSIGEPSTGETMGRSAERMAKENHISRDAQDQLALMSHQRAAAATADGRLTAEIAPWFGGPEMDQVTTADTMIRRDASLEALAKLKPVFDHRYGSVTAGNSSPLTDGASVTLMMAEAKARDLGYRPLATIRSYAVAAVDPAWQPLMGPAHAVPLALRRAGIGLEHLGLIEAHEAFASQVLSNVQAWASPEWAQRLGLGAPIGEVDWSRTNVMGGSIAIGHPFGATGSRLVTSLCNEMARRDVQFGLVSICTQGGMGFAMVLERV